jgi:hypothetical protein
MPTPFQDLVLQAITFNVPCNVSITFLDYSNYCSLKQIE